MPIIAVDTLADPRLDDYRNVPDPELLRARGVFMAEGRHVVRRLLEGSRFRTRSLLLTPGALASLRDAVAGADDLPVFVVSQETMNAVTGFNIHRGCLAAGERPSPAPWRELVRGASRVVVLERVANADNVGGIFRSAAAFGVDAVLLAPSCTDPLYRKAIRTSMGASLSVPFAEMPDWPGDLRRLGDAGFRVVALTPSSDAVDLRDALASNGPTALLVGHEGEGLTQAAMEVADVRARIAMGDGIDSLNVATAAAIALYELHRRRPGA